MQVLCTSVESEPMVLGSGSVRFGKSLGSVRFGSVSHTSPVRSVRFVLMKNGVRVRCVRFGFGSIPISTTTVCYKS